MSKSVTGKTNWALFLLLLAGIVLGGFIGDRCVNCNFYLQAFIK